MAAHMKMIVVCLTALILAPAAPPAATPALIPQPVSLRMQSGAFRLHSGIAIVVPPGVPEARQAATYLANALAAPTGWQLKVSESGRSSRTPPTPPPPSPPPPPPPRAGGGRPPNRPVPPPAATPSCWP